MPDDHKVTLFAACYRHPGLAVLNKGSHGDG